MSENHVAAQIVGGVLSIVATYAVCKIVEKFVLNPYIDKKLADIEARAELPTA